MILFFYNGTRIFFQFIRNLVDETAHLVWDAILLNFQFLEFQSNGIYKLIIFFVQIFYDNL